MPSCYPSRRDIVPNRPAQEACRALERIGIAYFATKRLQNKPGSGRNRRKRGKEIAEVLPKTKSLALRRKGGITGCKSRRRTTITISIPHSRKNLSAFFAALRETPPHALRFCEKPPVRLESLSYVAWGSSKSSYHLGGDFCYEWKAYRHEADSVPTDGGLDDLSTLAGKGPPTVSGRRSKAKRKRRQQQKWRKRRQQHHEPIPPNEATGQLAPATGLLERLLDRVVSDEESAEYEDGFHDDFERDPCGDPLVHEPAPLADSDLAEELRREWIETFERAYRLFPEWVVRKASQSSHPDLTLQALGDGQLKGTFYDSHGRVTEASWKPLDSGSNYVASCACQTFIKHRCCEHLAAMVFLTLQSLRDRQPEIYRLLQDVAEHELEQWERIDELAPDEEQELDEASDVPSLPETTPTRLFWTIEWRRSGLDILPRRQAPKKRGHGWVKGTLLLLHDFVECRNLPHPVDRALKEVVQVGPVARPFLDPVQALMILADHDLVEMDGEPVEIRVHSFTPCIHREGDRFRVGIGPGPQIWSQSRVLETPTGFVAGEMESHRLHVIPVPPSWRPFVRKLVTSRPFPRGVLKHVLAQLVPHSEKIGIRLPEDLGAPLVDSPADLHLVLRSSPRSELECALRVRDAKGRFFPPTEGPGVYLDTLEGKKIQRVRDIGRENRDALQARFRLRLDRAAETAPWTWRMPTIDDALELLQRAEELSAEGLFSVVWDPSTTHPMRVVGPIEPKNLVVRVQRKRDWFGLEGSCQAPAGEIPVEQLLEGVDGRRHGRYTEIRPGEFAEIAHGFASQLRRLRDTVHGKPGELEIGETAALALRDLAEQQKVSVTSDRHWQACLRRLSTAEALDPVPPEGLLAELRDYQVEGYRWLRRLSEWGVGACLADDMGLGKTVQMLAVLLDRASRGPALVIAPTSVGFNWLREAQRFAPDLNVHLYRETERADFLPRVGAGDVVVTSYGLALRDAKAFHKVAWNTVVLDEAQFIKNAQTKTARAIRDLQADWKVALTGTPIENRLSELWSIFRAVSPGLFGSWESFRKKFAVPIERHQDEERRQALSQLIQPFILRRTKEQVLKELPERTEMHLHVELSNEELRVYESMRRAALGEIEHLAGLPDAEDHRFRILAILTRLRQLACHVGLVDSSWTGSSSKLDCLVSTVEELRDEGHRVLVFSQFTSFLAKIREAFDGAEIRYQYLDGSTPAKARQRAVDAFQNGESDAFLISLKAGGTGLNLTAADYVIHADPWWNPAVEDQATDRAHRIGQTRPVMVYRLVARGTIEERILDLHREKRDLVENVLSGTQVAGKLTADELIELIRGNGD